MFAPTARVVDGQLIVLRPTSASFTVTLLSATLPVFCTANVYVIVLSSLDSVPVLVSTSDALCASGVVSVSSSVTGAGAGPPGGVGGWPLTVAVFTTWPAFTSPGCTVYTLPVQVKLDVAPAARVGIAGQLRPVSSGSLTVTFVSATLPVFCTANVYVIVLSSLDSVPVLVSTSDALWTSVVAESQLTVVLDTQPGPGGVPGGLPSPPGVVAA